MPSSLAIDTTVRLRSGTTLSRLTHNVRAASKLQPDEHGYEKALAAVDDSLKNFGFDYLDYMLIHSAMSDTPSRLAAWRGLLAAKAAAKVRSIGVSN